MHTPHDSGYKLLFSHPDMVRELIHGFVPDSYLHSLDYSTLEKVPGNFVSEEWSEREGDVIWRVKAGDEWLYVYLLIEFQSSIDRYMALRMMVYVGLLYQDLLKRKALGASGQLPPVLPIVLYNGERRWNAKLDVADLVVEVSGLLQQFKPNMSYLLIDEGSYLDADLASQRNLVAALFRLEQGDAPEALEQVLVNLAEWLADRPDLQKVIANWISAVLTQRPVFDGLAAQVNDLKELRVMLAERMKQWEQGFFAKGLLEGELKGKLEGMLEGERKGKLEAEQQMLLRLLSRKFGVLPQEVERQIQQATLPQLEAWLDRVLDAGTLGDVLNDRAAH